MTGQCVYIRVLGSPAPKGSPRVVMRGPGGVPLKAPRVLKDSPKTERWHDAVLAAAQAAMAGIAPFAGVPLTVEAVFGMRRPEGHYKKRGGLKPSAPRFPSVKPDLDKLLRSTMDPLEGVVFDGDSRIVRFAATKIYCELGEPEFAEVTISEITA